MLDDGRCGSISEMAAAEKIERGYLGKVLQLTLLPEVVEGRQRAEVSLPALIADTPMHWYSHP